MQVLSQYSERQDKHVARCTDPQPYTYTHPPATPLKKARSSRSAVAFAVFLAPARTNVQSSPLGEDSPLSKKEVPPLLLCAGGSLLSARSQCVRPLSPALLRFFSALSLRCSGRSSCGRGLRWVATLQSKPPPLPPPEGGLRGRPEEAKGGKYQRHTPTHTAYHTI